MCENTAVAARLSVIPYPCSIFTFAPCSFKKSFNFLNIEIVKESPPDTIYFKHPKSTYSIFFSFKKLISIFGSGDSNYMEFACLTFRIYLLLCICNGIQIPSGIFFQAIGKSIKSAILSISRQIALLIPAMIILSSIYGIMGILYAGPCADAGAGGEPALRMDKVHEVRLVP